MIFYGKRSDLPFDLKHMSYCGATAQRPQRAQKEWEQNRLRFCSHYASNKPKTAYLILTMLSDLAGTSKVTPLASGLSVSSTGTT